MVWIFDTARTVGLRAALTGKHDTLVRRAHQMLNAALVGLCGRVYIYNGRVSVCLSVPSVDRCRWGGFAAVGPAGSRYRSIAAAAGCRAPQRSAANASSVTLSAYVGSWTQTCDVFNRVFCRQVPEWIDRARRGAGYSRPCRCWRAASASSRTSGATGPWSSACRSSTTTCLGSTYRHTWHTCRPIYTLDTVLDSQTDPKVWPKSYPYSVRWRTTNYSELCRVTKAQQPVFW